MDNKKHEIYAIVLAIISAIITFLIYVHCCNALEYFVYGGVIVNLLVPLVVYVIYKFLVFGKNGILPKYSQTEYKNWFFYRTIIPIFILLVMLIFSGINKIILGLIN